MFKLTILEVEYECIASTPAYQYNSVGQLRTCWYTLLVCLVGGHKLDNNGDQSDMYICKTFSTEFFSVSNNKVQLNIFPLGIHSNKIKISRIKKLGQKI